MAWLSCLMALACMGRGLGQSVLAAGSASDRPYELLTACCSSQCSELVALLLLLLPAAAPALPPAVGSPGASLAAV
jgi:hypothetical protein